MLSPVPLKRWHLMHCAVVKTLRAARRIARLAFRAFQEADQLVVAPLVRLRFLAAARPAARWGTCSAYHVCQAASCSVRVSHPACRRRLADPMLQQLHRQLAGRRRLLEPEQDRVAIRLGDLSAACRPVASAASTSGAAMPSTVRSESTSMSQFSPSGCCVRLIATGARRSGSFAIHLAQVRERFRLAARAEHGRRCRRAAARSARPRGRRAAGRARESRPARPAPGSPAAWPGSTAPRSGSSRPPRAPAAARRASGS